VTADTGAAPPVSVVHVTEPVDGGVAWYLVDVVADQVRRGWPVTVVSPPDSEFVRRVRGAGGDHVPWPLPVRLIGERTGHPLAALVRGLRPLLGALSARGPDLVHLHAAQAGIAGRLVLRGRVPTVFQPHGWPFLAVEGIRRRAVAAWERGAARWAAAVVCVSEHELRQGQTAGIRARWRVVPSGVDVDRFHPPAPEERVAARERLGLPRGPLVVCVGALRRSKGQDVLLSAWPLVRGRVPGARLALVGGGPDREALAAAAPDGVFLAGAAPDVLPWLWAADVVAFPSRQEGLSIALLEAMAAACSVVATPVGGAVDALGGAGAVVPADDAPALARALATRLVDADLRLREGAEARARAVTEHDVRRTAGALAACYRDVLDAARR
jgi:glycosyltransferase involved in cell wall biosynthesis